MKFTAAVVLTLFLLFPLWLDAGTNPKFDDYFVDKTMRIDYFHIGDAKTDIITLDQVYGYGIWAGSQKNLMDNFNNGRFYIKIYDAASDTLIYSKGFDSYFGEYQLSGPAAKGIKKTYHETAIIPFPKRKIKFTVEKRNRKQTLDEIYACEIDPSDVTVILDNPTQTSVSVYKPVYNGDPHKKVDIAIIGEGYSLKDKEKFEADLKRFTAVFFKHEPYKSQKTHFNVYGVWQPSEESGVDEPRANIFVNTPLDATFNSMGSERYLLTENNRALRDIAAHVPYDALLIMCNHKRYGGGGIYNFFCTFTTDNQFHSYLLIHEFGHSFAGLADEYYTSSTAYNEFYPRGLEPVEPNITALLDPKNIKWKALISEGLEIPTPWEKKEFDQIGLAWQKKRREMNNRIAQLKREKASPAEIKKAEDDYAIEDKKNTDWAHKYLQSSKFWGKVGAFEGAGYSSEGLYRSMLNCIMFSKGDQPFCNVCQGAIARVIKHYTE